MAKVLWNIVAAMLIVGAGVLLVFGKRPSAFRLPVARGDGTMETGAGPLVRGRVVVTMWEKWSRHEAAAMQDLVDRFNLGQEKIFVNLVSMSQVNQKVLIATAGGDPPDICGLWAMQMGPYTANGALEPLEELVADGTLNEKTYKPYIWRICAPVGEGAVVWGIGDAFHVCTLLEQGFVQGGGAEPGTRAGNDRRTRCDGGEVDRAGEAGDGEGGTASAGGIFAQ